jgi:hypothetical protein
MVGIFYLFSVFAAITGCLKFGSKELIDGLLMAQWEGNISRSKNIFILKRRKV